ncbi:MAG: hypothetical protein JL50_10015 [Peptococcaceae bacterium BICA1-7]|nr:MAG: hypothetical protein JL50_10015 [Peptococcaceae bacterium BICA1-7]HBV95617.1 hypothetical protein [Desulfotomaculum sp.]
MEKKFDCVDAALLGGFLIVLGTICFMAAADKEVPALLQNIFWLVAGGLGMKKVPDTIGKW